MASHLTYLDGAASAGDGTRSIASFSSLRLLALLAASQVQSMEEMVSYFRLEDGDEAAYDDSPEMEEGVSEEASDSDCQVGPRPL